MTDVKLRSASEKDDKPVFVRYINHQFDQDKDVKHMLPLHSDDNSLFDLCASGLILAKMVNIAAPGVINSKRLNTQRPLSRVQQIENANMAIEGAKALACPVGSFKGADVVDGKTTTILGLLWQILGAIYESEINMTTHPELAVLKGKYEDLYKFEKVPVKDKLLRWINFHLFQEKHSPIKKFPLDLKKGQALETIMKRIAPSEWEEATKEQAEAEEEAQDENKAIDTDESRCHAIAKVGRKLIGGDDSPVTISAEDILEGSRILEVFCIAVFQNRNGLQITGDKRELARNIVEARFRVVSEQLPDVKTPQILSLLKVAHHFKEAISDVRSQTRSMLLAQEEQLEAQNAALKGAQELEAEKEDLSRENDTLRGQTEQLKKEKEQAEERVTSLQSQLENLEQRVENASQTETEMDSLRKEMNEMKENHAQEMEKLKEQLEVEKEEMKQQHREEILRLNQEHETKLQEQEQEHEKRVASIKEDLEAENESTAKEKSKYSQELENEKQQKEIIKAQLSRAEESQNILQSKLNYRQAQIERYDQSAQEMLANLKETREDYRFILTLAGVEAEEKLAKWRFPKMSPVHITDPQHHGYLVKRGSNWKSWKRRYFVLKDDWLFYYSNDMAETPSGFLCMVGCSAEPVDKAKTHKDFSFKFIAATRTLLCSAESEEDRDQWISMVTKHTNVDQSHLLVTEPSTSEKTDSAPDSESKEKPEEESKEESKEQ